MDISLKNLQKRIPLNPRQIQRIAAKILRHEKIRTASLSFVFVTDRRIKALNRKYLKRSYATDVLAFDLKDSRASASSPKSINGEIVISTDTVMRNARHFGQTAEGELMLCVIHGILHLMGFDDHRAGDIRRMRRKERELLRLVSRK